MPNNAATIPPQAIVHEPDGQVFCAPDSAKITVKYEDTYRDSGTVTSIYIAGPGFKKAIADLINIRPGERIEGFSIVGCELKVTLCTKHVPAAVAAPKPAAKPVSKSASSKSTSKLRAPRRPSRRP